MNKIQAEIVWQMDVLCDAHDKNNMPLNTNVFYHSIHPLMSIPHLQCRCMMLAYQCGIDTCPSFKFLRLFLGTLTTNHSSVALFHTGFKGICAEWCKVHSALPLEVDNSSIYLHELLMPAHNIFVG